MIVKVRVHPNSSKQEIKKLDVNTYGVWLNEKPVDNKANLKLIKLLKKHLSKEVRLVSGLKSRNKIFELK